MKNKKISQQKIAWLGGIFAVLLIVVIVAGNAGNLFQGALFSNLRPAATSNKIDSTKLKLVDSIKKPQNESTPDLNQDITRGELIQLIANRYSFLGKGSIEPVEVGCFTDVIGHPNEKAICWAKEQGYIQAFPDGKFRVNQSVNRAEAAGLFYKILYVNANPEALKKQLYNDVHLDAWFATSINTLALAEKVDIKPNTTDLSKSWFYPGTYLSKARAEYWINKF